ncbi:BLUF domain-containing protein [Sphingomonas sp. CARO-RG-8B-R24-01]|uniref:BLUF domain-containing protein n=1 Tax=Sphingomonas sp. CARO-RG-8B-R24-01 TaxID=2914831 RepID=UPI001F5AEDDC|nr:BLUF domain-containing protein [Sphingomonas sp. CARO-RG-8B-R24-01]
MKATSATFVAPTQQILYVSVSTVPGDGADLAGILEQSRHNNALDGITGLLWSDGMHFLQVIEGSPEGVTAAFARIRADGRHHHLRLLRDCMIPLREFGSWTMVHRRAADSPDLYDARMRRLLSETSQPIKQHFMMLIAGKTEPALEKFGSQPEARPLFPRAI